MMTHRIQDLNGEWRSVTKSTTRPGTFVEWHSGQPSRLWMPGQYNADTVKVI